MAAYYGGCTGPGTTGTYCVCQCHEGHGQACNDQHCAPVSAGAADNARLKHVNRNADSGKMLTKRGVRSLRKA